MPRNQAVLSKWKLPGSECRLRNDQGVRLTSKSPFPVIRRQRFAFIPVHWRLQWFCGLPSNSLGFPAKAL